MLFLKKKTFMKQNEADFISFAVIFYVEGFDDTP